MSKRRNENGQMRREEYEANDSGEEVIEMGFQRASEDSIRKRKIVKARVGPRSTTTTQQSNNNPFGGFQGLTASASAAEKKHPFAGFAGLTSSTGSKLDASTFGSVGAPQITSNLNAMEAYEEAFTVLNKEFKEFISEQQRENPSSSWNAAVEEYVKLANEISIRYLSKGNNVSASKTELTTRDSCTSAPGNSTKMVNKSHGKAPSGGNSVAQSNKNLKETKLEAEPSSLLPISATTINGGYSFEAVSSSKPDSNSLAERGISIENACSLESTAASRLKPFSFELGSSLNATGKQPFVFGQSDATISSTTSNSPEKRETKEVEDEENIGREAATIILKVDNPDEDVRFEVEKAKIFEFKKDEKRWADKGVHPLKVLTNKCTTASRILVRNEIGKIVLNSAIYKGMAVKGHEVKGKQVGVILPLQVGETMSQFLLKVKPENVDGLKRALEICAG